MYKKILLFGVFLCLGVNVFASRFLIDATAEYRLLEGTYVYASPTVYFERRPSTERPYSFYAPGLALNVGYSYANIPNYNLPHVGTHYSFMKYHSLYCGLSFVNKFMINRHNGLILSAFADIRLGGKNSIVDGGTTGCGLKLDYRYFISDRIAFGGGIIGTYAFAGDYKGFDGGIGVQLTCLI